MALQGSICERWACVVRRRRAVRVNMQPAHQEHQIVLRARLRPNVNRLGSLALGSAALAVRSAILVPVSTRGVLLRKGT
jgi:hypothetical protein